MKVALHSGDPGAVDIGGHFNLLFQIIDPVIAGFVQIDFHGGGGGRPDPEGGSIFCPDSAQVIAFVGIEFLKGGGGVVDRHGNGMGCAPEHKGVGSSYIQGMFRHQGIYVFALIRACGDGHFSFGTGDGKLAGVNGGGHGYPDAYAFFINDLLDLHLGGFCRQCGQRQKTQNQRAQQQDGDDTDDEFLVHDSNAPLHEKTERIPRYAGKGY